MYSGVDLRNEPLKPKLYLCRPDRTIVGIIKEAFNIKRPTKLGNINQLSFDVPFFIEQQHEFIENPNIKNLKNRYHIKFVKGNEIEWYIINNPTDRVEEDGDFKTIEAFSLPIELGDKNIRDYHVISYNASQVLQDALSNTIWTIGTVDAVFDTMYRSFDVSSTRVLDFIIEIAETFNALLEFDTVNRTVSLRVFMNKGQNRGLVVSHGNLLKTASKVEDSSEFCTRMKVFGKNGISIHGNTIAGQNYIEDYSYFIYPFKREDGVIVSHSNYMSDSLCIALLDYKELLETQESVFQDYLDSLSDSRILLTQRQNELFNLQNDLIQLEDSIAAANYNDENPDSLIAQKNAKLIEIQSKESEIDSIENTITTITNNINSLRNSISIENNFTPEQVTEWNQFIIEQVYENNNIEEQDELLKIAAEVFEKVKQPKITVEISMINLLECITEQKKWDLLKLGDIITIQYDGIGLKVQAKIIEMDFDYESGDITVRISNYDELLTDQERFMKDFYKSNMTSQSVNMDKYKWTDAYTNVNEVSSILASEWDATDRGIKASFNNTVDIGRQGVIVTSPDNPDDRVIVQSGVIALSRDGGNHWSTAINARGVFAERLVGQILAGNDLVITNSGGSFFVNETGVTIAGNALTITDGLPDSQITSASLWNTAKELAESSVQLGSAYNGIIINTASGLVVTKSDNTIRGLFNATDGIKFQKREGSNWVDKLFYNASTGNLTIDGEVNARELKVNGVSVLTVDKAKINGQYIDKITTDQLVAGSAKISTAMIENLVVGGNVTMGANASLSWNQITNQPSASDLGALPANSPKLTHITATGIYSGEIVGEQIKSNSTIAVTTDLTLGNNLYLNGVGTQSIVMFGGGNISMSPSGMEIAANQEIYLDSSTVTIGSGSSTVDVRANNFRWGLDTIATQQWVTSQLGDYATETWVNSRINTEVGGAYNWATNNFNSIDLQILSLNANKADKTNMSGTIYVATSSGGPANYAVTVTNGVITG